MVMPKGRRPKCRYCCRTQKKLLMPTGTVCKLCRVALERIHAAHAQAAAPRPATPPRVVRVLAGPAPRHRGYQGSS